MSKRAQFFFLLMVFVAAGLDAYRLDLPFFSVDGQLWVYGQVGEVEGFFLLDTGANLVLLYQLPKNRSVDPQGKAVKVRLGGVTREEPLYLLDQITINGHVLRGDFRFAEAPAPVVPRGATIPVAGILGLGMFNQGFVRILHSSSLLQFTNLDTLMGQWTTLSRSEGHLVVSADLESGRSVDLILDSGAPRTILPESALDFGGPKGSILTGQTLTPSLYYSTSDRFHEVFLPRFSVFQAPPIQGIVYASDCGLLGGRVGTLGNDFLRFFDLTIDFAGNRVKAVTAKPMDVDDQPFSARMRGFGLGAVGRSPEGKLIVTELYLDTPFTQAGFRLGDVLDTVDDRPSAAMSLGEVRTRLQQPEVHVKGVAANVGGVFRQRELLGQDPGNTVPAVPSH